MPFRSMWKALFLLVVFLAAAALDGPVGNNSAFAAVSGDASITVVSPAGGEVWMLGSKQTIQWRYTGNPGRYVKIELYKGGKFKSSVDGNYTGKSIGTSGDGSWTWKKISPSWRRGTTTSSK